MNFIRMLSILAFTICSLQGTLDISDTQAYSVALKNDGSLFAAGYVTINDIQQFMVAKYTSFGTIDLNFGKLGYVATKIGKSSLAQRVIVNKKQVIVAGGQQSSLGSGFAIARYNANGLLDATFNGNGIQKTVFDGNGGFAYGATTDENDSYVVAGVTFINNKSVIAITRYTANGQLDGTFGNQGIVTTQSNASCGAHAVAVQDNKITIAGFSTHANGNSQFIIARYLHNGMLDFSLNGTGIVTTTVGLNAIANALLIQPNDLIVAGGYSTNQFALVRYNNTGTLDTTFGTNGIVLTAIGSTSQIKDVALQLDGKIVAVGYSDNNLALARYTTKGILDISFGQRGVVTTAIGTLTNGTSLVILPNGQIVVCGNCDTGAMLVRYNSDGSVDTSFGSDGVIRFPNTLNAPDIFDITDVNIADGANIQYKKLNLSNSIINSDINDQAAIQDTKLQTLQSPGKVLNQATTASPLNSSNAIVARDTLGNFSANTITSNLVGTVSGSASLNVLKSGDTMSGNLVLPAGSQVAPSLQFSGSENTGFSALLNTLILSTKGFKRLSIDNNGGVAIAKPLAGSALNIDGDTVISSNTSCGQNLVFNTNVLPLNSVGSTQGPLMKVYVGVGNTGISGSASIDYNAAGFQNIPTLCVNSINGIAALLTIQSITNTSAVIASGTAINVPFNYIAIGA